MASGHDTEEMGGKRLHVVFRYPGYPQIGVNVTGQHVLRLDGAQRLRVAGIGGSGTLGSGEFCADITR